MVRKTRWEGGELWEVSLDSVAWPFVSLALIYVPFQPSHGEQDCWILCELIEARGQQRSTRRHTHYVSVFLANHIIAAIDPDSIAIIYEQPWDLQGRSPYRNTHVRCIMLRVAAALRVNTAWDVQWASMIFNARRECLGGGMVRRDNPRAPIDIIVEPYDPGTVARRISDRKRPQD